MQSAGLIISVTSNATINIVLGFISEKPESSIALEVDSGKINPQMHRNIIHPKVFLTPTSPHLWVITIKHWKINSRQLWLFGESAGCMLPSQGLLTLKIFSDSTLECQKQ
jgi:hypothetical protein